MSKIFYHQITIIFATVITIILCISLYLNTAELRGSSGNITRLEGEVSQQHSKVAELQKTLAEAQQPAAKEKIIRDQLLMQKPGEFVIQVPDLPVSIEKKTDVTPKPTPWQEWQKLLLD